MSVKDILEANYDKTTGLFSDLIVQMFVEESGKFNFTHFNRFYEQKVTHQEIVNTVLLVSGSKVIPYRKSEASEDSFVFDLFTKAYKFGKFEHARDWIAEVYEQTGVVLNRSTVLGWIATQRPERNTKAFLPANDGDIYRHDKYEEPAA